MLNNAKAGQMIFMLDGTYAPDSQYLIPRSVSGTSADRITLMPVNVGHVKISGEHITSGSILHIVGSYWHIYGIAFYDRISAVREECSNIKGVSVSGNHNIVELCQMHDVGNSGLQISRYAGEPNAKELWPSYNLIKNCDAWNCCDPSMNDADGFAAKLTCGEGNKFYGCISHHNIDDGWDLYAKSTTGEIGAVTIENCVTYSNGFLLTDDRELAAARGEGNGFKLGGENMYGGHKLINSVSYNNYAKGKQIVAKWGKVPGATAYDIYVQYCGSDFTAKAAATVKGSVNAATVTKVNGKAVDTSKEYKAYIVARNGKTVLGKSVALHGVASGRMKVYTDAKAVTVAKTALTLKQGKSANVGAKLTLVNSKLKQLSDKHAAALRFASTDTRVATVDAKGNVTAKSAGMCLIYVFARTGLTKTVRVTVK